MNKSVLDVDVSYISNYFAKDDISTINLLSWLSLDTYKEQIKYIRSLDNKEQRDKLKAKLPAILPGGVFTRADSSSLIKASGFLQFDIDQTGNEHIECFSSLKQEIMKIENIAYCGLSASGRGLWGLIPVKYPDMLKAHFKYVSDIFTGFGIFLDSKPKNIASLRGYSYDEAAFFNHQAITLEKYHIKESKRPATLTVTTTDYPIDEKHVLECITQIEARRVDITILKHPYDDWFSIGCNFASSFRESGRDYFHRVSQFYMGYDTRETDDQFDKCLLFTSKPNLDTFFRRCEWVGIRYDSNEEG